VQITEGPPEFRPDIFTEPTVGDQSGIPRVIVGYLLAACAALASGTGSVLESTGIRRAGIFGGTSFDLVLLRKQ